MLATRVRQQRKQQQQQRSCHEVKNTGIDVDGVQEDEKLWDDMSGEGPKAELAREARRDAAVQKHSMCIKVLIK